jgi:hypothetical protein
MSVIDFEKDILTQPSYFSTLKSDVGVLREFVEKKEKIVFYASEQFPNVKVHVNPEEKNITIQCNMLCCSDIYRNVRYFVLDRKNGTSLMDHVQKDCLLCENALDDSENYGKTILIAENIRQKKSGDLSIPMFRVSRINSLQFHITCNNISVEPDDILVVVYYDSGFIEDEYQKKIKEYDQLDWLNKTLTVDKQGCLEKK